MKNLFDNPENVAKLTAEVQSWAGTPWYHLGADAGYHRAVKGLRGNCVHIVVAIYENCGFIGKTWIPAHAANTGQSREDDAMETLAKVLQSFVADGRMVRVDGTDKLMPGDILTFRFAARDHHIGIWLGKEFYHCSGGAPATAKFHADTLGNTANRRALRGIYRLVAE